MSKNSYSKPPVANNTQHAGYSSTTRPSNIDYNDFNSKNGWLDRYSGDMKTILGLEESGTFEQMEKLAGVEHKFQDPKGIFNVQENEFTGRNNYRDEISDGKESLDLTGLETLKRISGKNEPPKPTQVNTKPAPAPHQNKLLFDCDVSEIKQNK